MCKARLVRLAFFTVVALGVPAIGFADNCSSPDDCMQTAGYNATMAVGAGALALFAAMYGAHLTAGPQPVDPSTAAYPTGDEPLPEVDVPTTGPAVGAGEPFLKDRGPYRPLRVPPPTAAEEPLHDGTGPTEGADERDETSPTPAATSQVTPSPIAPPELKTTLLASDSDADLPSPVSADGKTEGSTGFDIKEDGTSGTAKLERTVWENKKAVRHTDPDSGDNAVFGEAKATFGAEAKVKKGELKAQVGVGAEFTGAHGTFDTNTENPSEHDFLKAQIGGSVGLKADAQGVVLHSEFGGEITLAEATRKFTMDIPFSDKQVSVNIGIGVGFGGHWEAEADSTGNWDASFHPEKGPGIVVKDFKLESK